MLCNTPIDKYNKKSQESVLKMHPKFAIMEDLKEGGLEFEQELAYAKIRIQIKKELDEQLEGEENVEMTQEDEQVGAELCQAQEKLGLAN